MLAAIGVGPIFTLPFLANTPTAPRLCSPCFASALARRAHPRWLYSSSALFLAVVVSMALVLAPAASRTSDEPELRGRRIAALMVLRPGAS